MSDRDLLLSLIRVLIRCAKTFLTLMEGELKERGLDGKPDKRASAG